MTDCCPDSDNYVEVEVEANSTKFKLNFPMAFHLSGANPLDSAVPAYTGRQFQRPVFGEDGVIEYPRLVADTVPPDEIDGYQRDPGNAWRFLPLWPPCIVRGVGATVKENGCIQVVLVCGNPDAPPFLKTVTCAQCLKCEVRGQP